MPTRSRSNPLVLGVLTSFHEHPMYPYEVATQLRQRQKHETVRLNSGSLYGAVESLERRGLVEAQDTERAWPARAHRVPPDHGGPGGNAGLADRAHLRGPGSRCCRFRSRRSRGQAPFYSSGRQRHTTVAMERSGGVRIEGALFVSTELPGSARSSHPSPDTQERELRIS